MLTKLFLARKALVLIAFFPLPGLFFSATTNAASPIYAYVSADTRQPPSVIDVIDTTSNTVVARVAPGSRSWVVKITPDGRYAYVANLGSGDVSVIETISNQVVDTVFIGTGSEPAGLDITPDGRFAYVANFRAFTVSVINTNSNAVDRTIVVGQNPVGLVINPDGTSAYVANFTDDSLSVISIATNTVVATVPNVRSPRNMTFSRDGRYLYITSENINQVSVVDTRTYELVATVPVGTRPCNAATTPDGSFVWVTNCGSSNVSIIDTANNQVVAEAAAGQSPDGIAFTPDGAFAYVANYDDNNVWIIDAQTGNRVDTVGVGSNPNWVAITPPPRLACQGFDPPMDRSPVSVKNRRALPLKARLFDDQGAPVTVADISAAPVVQIVFNPETGGSPEDVTSGALAVGKGTSGNQFVFTNEGKWQYNLRTDNFTAAGSYDISMVPGNAYTLSPTCRTSFVVK